MNRFFPILCIAAVCSACTSSSITMKQTNTQTVARSQTNTTDEIRHVNDELCRLAGICKSLYAEGTITMRDGRSSQSGQFTLRSKRINAGGDSLSMIVRGPFGITAAKFLGSATEFNFYNAIEGEHYHGNPDAKTLERLTGMKGISLSLLNDLIYGVSPIRLDTADLSEVSTEPIDAQRSRLVVRRNNEQRTEAIIYSEVGNSVRILSYERWNSILDARSLANMPPDLTVKYSGNINNTIFMLPNFITATSGSQSLELEYSQANENKLNMDVNIKIPK